MLDIKKELEKLDQDQKIELMAIIKQSISDDHQEDAKLRKAMKLGPKKH